MLDALMNPASVAVIGASDDPTRIGGRPLHYLQRAAFAGPIYPINPKRSRVQDMDCYASIDDVHGQVDLAVVSVPGNAVESTLESCAARGVRAAVVFSAGFAEMDQGGAAAQQRLRDIARAGGLRVLGPNCLGAYNAEVGLYATFTTSLEFGFPEPGRVGIVSQSGAYGAYVALLARRRHIAAGHWITTGNECDIELAECILWMAQNPQIEVIVAAAEGIRDGPQLLHALRIARELRKPVVFIKVGRSPSGTRAAASHTASMAGSDAVYNGVFEQFGVYRASDTEELLDVAYACSRGQMPANERVGLMTISGGIGIQMADAAEALGLEVADMPADAQSRLKEILPYASPRNPVDVTGQIFNDLELLAAFLDAMLSAGDYGAIVAFYTYVASVDAIAGPIREAVEGTMAKYPNRLLVLSIIAPDDIVTRYEQAGCLVFEDPTRAVRAVAALTHFVRAFANSTGGIAAAASSAPAGLRPLPRAPLNEFAAKQLLAAAGIPIVEERFIRDEQAAQDAAHQIGYPVVLKLSGSGLAHKSELGGVILDIDSPAALATACAALSERAAAAPSDAAIDGMLLSRQVEGGVEMILGTSHDSTFGPQIMVGLGGIFAELMGDSCFRVAPVDEREARRMVESLRGHAILGGLRGRAPSDIEALIRAIVSLSEFAHAHAGDVESVDINPFIVLAAGQGALALDALVIAGQD